MGVIIKGTDDSIKAADGSLSIEGFSIKTSGIGTFDGGIQVGSAATIHSNGNLGLTGILTATNFKTGDSNVHNTGYNIGAGASIHANGNIALAGIVTANGGVKVGAAISLHSNGNLGITGVMTASSYVGDGSALTGVAGTEITNSDFQVGVSTFFVDYSTGRIGINTTVPTSTLDLTGNAVVSGIITATTFYPSVGQLGNRNVIINGGCLVAQRSTSSTSSGYGSVDRMQMSVTNTDELAFAQKQTTDYPDGFSKCFEFDVTTVESSLAVDELVYMRYLVEAQDLRPFYNADGTGKDFTLSFWVKAKQTGTYSLGIHKGDNTTRFITTTYTIDAADTWQFVEWNITGDTNTSGINADNGQGFQIAWIFAAGTNYTSGGVQSSWGAFANTLMAGGQVVNSLDNTANYWRITGIQLELGSKATPFEHRRYGDELLRCQRYYQRFGENFGTAFAGKGSGSTTIVFAVPLSVPLRASPTVTQAGNVYQWGPSNAGYENATVSVSKWMANVPQIWLSQGEHSTVANDRCLVVTPYGGSSGADPDLALSAEL